ncbi:hypothetical protein FP803_01600 [Candidatus Woesearchaeota archaeon]|nr:hypothetical protein [Candidatus Woesearchaeota archaeon]
MVPEDNKNKKHINDIVTGAYNSARNFCIDNKGILINYGLGIAQIVAGVKGCQYAKELNQPLLYLGSNVLWIRGVVDIGIGSYRSLYNLIVVNSYVDDMIRGGFIPEEKRKERIESMKMYKNNEVATPERFIKDSVKITKELYLFATSKSPNNPSN